MATSKQTQYISGFDCEFVEKLSEKRIQSECPVCLQILREPYQVSCCKYSFCQVCIERVRNENKVYCPTCKENRFDIFHNKGLQCSLYEFQVYCSHKQEGCEWKGELGQLDNHLNLSPQPDKQQEGCEYSEIECIYCSESIKRSNITVHQNDHCPKRPFSCEYCQSYESHYEDVIHNHWLECGCYPVICPNECGVSLQRQDMKNHIIKDCPNATIDCDFHNVGCDVRLPRKDMPAHLEKNLVTHMSLQAASHTALQYEVQRLRTENQTLKEQLTSLPTLQQTIITLQKQITDLQVTQQLLVPHNGTPPYEIIMTNFEEHRQEDREWFSPPFYTHHRGYKLCLNVCINNSLDEDSDTKYIGVFLRMMRGEFDDSLEWPCKKKIVIQLVDQEGEEKHIAETIVLDESVPGDITNRVTCKTMGDGWGNDTLITHDKLKPNYLKHNTLCFKITHIE